jgi:nucleotide-binding universal stress UspA family protein
MTVVVGYVPTPEGRAAVDAAAEEARRRSSRLLVLNASKGDSYADPRYARPEELEQVRRELEAAAVEVEVRQQVRGREPSEELVSLAAQENAELLVIGLRRRTAVGKLIMGSTAQRILLDASCPVLAVKAKDSAG